MGLYLCVFADSGDDEELDGVEVGSYEDFGRFRRTVADRLEPAGWGSRFPLLMSQPDSDGRFDATDTAALEAELRVIAAEFDRLPPVAFPSGWQADAARRAGLVPGSLRDCFIDVDAEPLLDRLADLAATAAQAGLPILFQ